MKLDWKAGLGLAVTALAFWWVLKDVEFAEVWSNIRRGDLLLLLASVFVATSGFLVRAMRWKVLLAPLEPDTKLRSRFAAVSVGFMTNNVLPARIGEFTRAYAFSRLEPVTVSAAFGTLVVERVLDGIVLVGILLFTISWSTFPGSDVLEGSSMGSAVQGILVLLGVLVVGLVVLMLRPRPFIRVAERVAARMPGDFARPVVDALEAFLGSLAILRRPALLVQAVLWSVGFWLFHGVSFWLGLLAFGIRPEDSFIAALFTEAVVGFGVAVPSAPGFFGTFHAAADWALTGVYEVPQAQSLAFAFGYHFGGWIPITVIGLWYAWKLGLSLEEVGSSEERVEAAVEAAHPLAAELLAERGDRPHVSAQNPRPTARAVEVEAPAKVNLALRVLERERDTGFHRIETLFQAVSLCDRLRIEVAGRGVELEVEGADLGPPRENLVWQAAAAFAAETGLVHGLRIRLLKRIPAAAGLGGGSSDAGATLRALNALFGRPVPQARLAELGARVGSDVPFFVGEGALALAGGRGERLTPLSPLPQAFLVLAMPPVHVATGGAYGALAVHRDGAVPPPLDLAPSDRPLDWERIAALAVNDFEAVVPAAHPPVAEALEALRRTHPRLVLLGGSGAAAFAVYGSEADAVRALETLEGAREGRTTYILASTLGALPGSVLEGPAAP